MYGYANERDFDLKLACEGAQAFHRVTGLGCAISDGSGGLLAEVGQSYASCPLCAAAGKNFPCADAHSYGMDEAQRFGGRYIYFCPAGLAFFVSPIMGRLGSVAKITAGPFLLVEREDFSFLELRRTLGLAGQRLRQSRKALEAVPQVEPERVTDLSTLLFMAVGFISNVWSAAQMAESRNAGQTQSAIHDYVLHFKQEERPPDYPYELEERLLSGISSHDSETAGEALNQLLGHIFFTSGGELERIKSQVYELLVLMSRAAVRGGADPAHAFQLNHTYLQQLQSFGTLESLCQWLTGTVNRFMDTTFRFQDVRHLDVIHKAVQYIHHNCGQKLTVEQVAREVYLSPSYFSKIFKQEMGCNFSAYINQVRIGKSKELLRNQQYRLIDIAVMTGFEDQSYFTKVFKRVVGVSPNRYREANGRM